MAAGDPQRPRTAGLSLSVGSASFPLRCFLALMFGVFGLLCLGAAVAISHLGPAAATVLAVLAIVPLGCLGVLGAVYTLAPFSRFGLWLDVFAGNLTWPRLFGVFVLFWAIGVVLVSFRTALPPG
jgi:hypothetical protein